MPSVLPDSQKQLTFFEVLELKISRPTKPTITTVKTFKCSARQWKSGLTLLVFAVYEHQARPAHAKTNATSHSDL